MRPLEGVVVVDFSTLLPGPLATLLLAEAGAEVIKLERPTGDDLRSWSPQWGDSSVHYALLNRGKRCVTIDLNKPGDRAAVDALLDRADVLVEQYRPSVMQHFGLDYESLASRYPRLIYCSITGYGQSGPMSATAGHDLNYIATTGMLALSMGPPGAPVLPPALIADIAAGAYPAVMNILLALHARERSGQGCHLDVSMTDNLFTLMFSALGEGFSTGNWPKNGNGIVTGGSPRYRLYATKEGGLIAVAALEDRFWNVFCETIALDTSLRNDVADPAATAAAIARIIAGETTWTWADRFRNKDCCCSTVRDLSEAVSDPHFVHRGITREVLDTRGGRSIPALHVPIVRLFRSPVEIRARTENRER